MGSVNHTIETSRSRVVRRGQETRVEKFECNEHLVLGRDSGKDLYLSLTVNR
ncbi:MAG: hypothetical protein RBG13Loki_1533 [Promethearchaeota archaeon CR_4]|nr:MAG: hypothetical protein RBG13Loki_1533 [Candidatus Lokiarchaeota archaeon CR_4]